MPNPNKRRPHLSKTFFVTVDELAIFSTENGECLSLIPLPEITDRGSGFYDQVMEAMDEAYRILARVSNKGREAFVANMHIGILRNLLAHPRPQEGDKNALRIIMETQADMRKRLDTVECEANSLLQAKDRSIANFRDQIKKVIEETKRLLTKAVSGTTSFSIIKASIHSLEALSIMARPETISTDLKTLQTIRETNDIISRTIDMGR